ncbi:hypothetical protein LSAT2_011828 [Lamellibrachia satsuma]|nr:hypothetical protein LSAT2_011828 [Lamellibrachia satsuma]
MPMLSVLVALLACHDTAGARCRFANTSTSQGSCIFPCRCTDGCNTTTGDCLNGGDCEDGHPSAYRWNGTACQIGVRMYREATVDTCNMQLCNDAHLK